MNQYRPIAAQEAKEMADLYATGVSSYEVAKRFGRSYKSVTNCVLRTGGKLRNNSECQKKLRVDEDYFKHIDTPTKAYLLGFIYADGNVFKNRFKISLWETDKYFLELFAKEIEFDGKLYCEKSKISTRQNMWSLTVYGRVFVNHLRDKGVIDNKVNILTWPEWMPKNLRRYFIHGLMDGDGSITHSKANGKTYPTVGFAGAKALIRRLKSIIKEDTGIDGSYFDRAERNGGRLHFSSTKALRLAQYLYANTAPFFLIRKREKYVTYLKQWNAEHPLHVI